MSIPLLFWGILFSAIGLGYFIYGKRQTALNPLICGLCLMLMPFVVHNSYVLVPLCALLVFIPYYWRE